LIADLVMAFFLLPTLYLHFAKSDDFSVNSEK